MTSQPPITNAATGATAQAKPMVDIFTDGGSSPNPGAGAWAALLRYNGVEKEISGYVADTTNNRMELSAALEALRTLTKPAQVRLHTDSQYLQKGMQTWIQGWVQRGWKTADKKPVKNEDLWKALDLARERHVVRIHWVKGHAGDAGNEAADRLAQQGIDELKTNQSQSQNV